MTILPSRSAPPVPITSTRSNQQQQQQQHSAIMSAWSQNNDNHHQQQQHASAVRKKPPPPRPPLPQALAHNGDPHRHNQSPQSVASNQPKNIASLTNIFRRMKTNDNPSRDLFSLPPPPKAGHRSIANAAASHQQQQHQQQQQSREPLVAASNTVELISFDSPPNSPTPTQKSVSSWNSSLSFSGSDLATVSSSSQMVNWTPTRENHTNSNGGACSVSTTHSESGFEDDFTSQAMFDPFSPEIGVMPVYGTAPSAASTAYGANNASKAGNSNFWSADFLDPLCNGKSLLPPEPVVTMPTIIRPVMKATTTVASKTASSQHPISTMSAISGPSSSSKMQQRDVKRVNKPKESYAVVLYQYDALQEGDLNLKPSEKVFLLRQINDDWFFGRNEHGQEGMLPTAYVDVKIPLPVDRHEPDAAQTTGASASAVVIDKSHMPQAASAARPARALFTFMAQTADDLTIFEGEHVGVLHVINDDWWYGETVSGRGQFPAAYVELL